MKFGRDYRLTIDAKDGEQVIVEPPFTVQFNIIRSTMSSLNSMNMHVYNLGEKTRSKLFKDFFDFKRDRKVTFEAGYAGQLSTVFKGSIYEANSAREGVDVVTIITSQDGGYDTPTAMTFQTLQVGSEIKDVFKTLIGSFPNLSLGSIGDFAGKFSRPVVLSGNSWSLLKTYSNKQCFIDLEKVYVLPANQTIEAEGITLIDVSTGLLETPRRDGAYLTMKTLFEPAIVMGQELQASSSILPEYDGQYKVVGVQHEGIISEAKGGKCTTTIKLLLGSQAF